MVVFIRGAAVKRRSFMNIGRSALVVLVALWIAACATGGAKKPPTGTPEPDRFLWERGTDALNKKRWIVAREYFRQLVDGYPQSPYRADAKLGVGDSYLGEGSAEAYVLGINEYREFLSFYPTHARSYYAQFKLGMAHFYQMRAPARDQTETREAVRELTVFVERYPTCPLVDEGKQHLREAKDRIGDSEFAVGQQYYRMKYYPGAIGRLKPLIESDPGYSNRDAAFFYLGESLVGMQQSSAALPYFERIVKEFDQSQYLERARKRIEELQATLKANTSKGSPS
jgi:outer membrane protein assembly factor BamD